MAIITTAQAGLFSAAATWVGGVKPSGGDVADCDHDVEVDEHVDAVNWDIAAGVTVTVNAGVQVTGQTADVITGDKTAHLSLEAGASWKWNSAVARSLSVVKLTTRGTSDAWCTIDNLGGGAVASAIAGGDFDLAYLDWLHNGATYADARSVRLRNVNINKGSFFYLTGSDVDIDGAWLSGMDYGWYGVH